MSNSKTITIHTPRFKRDEKVEVQNYRAGDRWEDGVIVRHPTFEFSGDPADAVGHWIYVVGIDRLAFSPQHLITVRSERLRLRS